MEPYILIGVSAIWFGLGYIFSDSKRKKEKNIIRKGSEVVYKNKNNEIENAIVCDDALESSQFIIVKKESNRYTPVYIIRRTSVTDVFPLK